MRILVKSPGQVKLHFDSKMIHQIHISFQKFSTDPVKLYIGTEIVVLKY